MFRRSTTVVKFITGIGVPTPYCTKKANSEL